MLPTLREHARCRNMPQSDVARQHLPRSASQPINGVARSISALPDLHGSQVDLQLLSRTSIARQTRHVASGHFLSLEATRFTPVEEHFMSAFRHSPCLPFFFFFFFRCFRRLYFSSNDGHRYFSHCFSQQAFASFLSLYNADS